MPDVGTVRVVLPQAQIVTVDASFPAPIVASITGVRVFPGGGTGGAAFTLNASTGSVSLIAGNNITLQSNASTITIVGGAGAGAAFTLNASTGSVSLVAGPDISLASNLSTITISNKAAFSTLSGTFGGNTLATDSTSIAIRNTFSVEGSGLVSVGGSGQLFVISASSANVVSAIGTAGALSTGSIVLVAGNNITLQTGANSITISAAATAAAATQSFSGGGTSITGTGISVALVGGNNISLASASGVGSLTLTIHGSSNATNNVSSLNGSSGALSVSAGAGIGIGNAASTITISASNQTSSLSYVAAIGTGAATSTGTIVLAAGANITLNTGASSITIVGAAAAAGTVSMTALGNTTESTSGTYTGLLNVSGAGGVSIGAGAQSLTISGPTQTSLVAGAGIAMTSAGSTITVAASQTTLVAGAMISLTSGGSSITIVGVPAALSLTQILPLAEVAGTAVSKAGTVTGTAGVGSSLFLQRINLPGKMSLTEIDAAMSIGFPATSQGAGTMSRSMVVYSFGNSTSLASVMSVSGTSAWNTGTSTVGASISLTQFQGGWSSPLIQPFTFASSSVSPGDYVVGQLFNFAQGSSTWTLALYGGQAYSSVSANAFTALAGSGVTGTVAATVPTLTAAGTRVTNLSAGSGITGVSSYGSAFLAGSMISVISSMSISAAVVMSSSSTGTLAAQISLSSSGTQKTATIGVGYVSTNSNMVSSIGVQAGSVIVGTLSNVEISGTAAGSVITAVQAGSVLTATASVAAAQLALPNFGFIGTGSTTSGFPTAFMAGIMSTGAVPAAITLTSTAVTYSGSIAFQQPWFALAGA